MIGVIISFKSNKLKSEIMRNQEKQKKNQNLGSKGTHNHGPSFKRGVMQSQDFPSSVRRHSVYGHQNPNPDFGQPFTVRVSSKEMKSLQKYRSTGRHESERQSIEKIKSHREDESHKLGQHRFLAKKAYKYLNMIGKGGFGKVWKVEHIASGRLYAMKEMSKAMQKQSYCRVITKRSIDSILNQRQLLATLRHKFIVNMVYAFQDDDNLFIIMNLMEGGDLRYHLSKMTVFSEGQTKFMIASIIMALDYLHSKMIMHRDLKPENIVFDRQGLAYLTDLGIAKHLRPNNSEDTSGTPGYMAPEVMFHHSHRYEVDYYALGVILYEIMMGKRPYLGKSRQEIKQKIKEKQVLISKKEIPEGWSIEAADFANKLLQRKPIERLGWAGIDEIKDHPWLRYFPWNDLLTGKLESPMKRFYNHAEVRYRPTENDTNYNRLLNKNKEMLKRGAMQDYFQGYTFEHLESTAENTRMY